MRHLTSRNSALMLATGMLATGLGIAGAQAATTPPTTTTTPAPSTTPAMTASQKAMISHVDANLAALKKTIGITQSEESSWNGFTQVSRTNALNLAGMYETRAKTLSTMNAVQNMDSYAAISAKNADDMNALSAAFQTLYAKLTPTQQKAIDARFRAKAQAMTAKHLKKMKHS